jgi:stage II sporulation protein D
VGYSLSPRRDVGRPINGVEREANEYGMRTVRHICRRGRCLWFPPLAALLLVCVPAGCTQKGSVAASPGAPVIRVRLYEAQSQVTVASNDTFAVREAPGVSPRPLNVPRKTPVPVLRTPRGWRVGDTNVDALELTLLSIGDAGGYIHINGKPYRGDCRLVPVGTAEKFDVINDVDLEGYLKGVLAKELYRDWHEEAYKAQCITARTYALYEMKTAGANRPWDVHADVRSQVYGGVGGENGLSQQASDATAGVVLAFGPTGQEKIFKAYFSSCCGGISQSASDAFGDPPFPPLTDQNVGVRCNQSEKFNWGPLVFTKDDLTRRFRAWGASKNRPEKDMAPVARIDIAHANRWGRPVRFMVTDTRGQRYSLNGTELRFAINSGAAASNGQTVHSSFFTPVDEPASIRFVDGHGFGHGVGLCQWCAESQAEAGVRHEDIVLNAFPGASLRRAY